MNSLLSSPVRQSTAAFLSLSFLSLSAAFLSGCAGGSSSSAPPLAGNTPVTVLASSTANDQFSGLTLNITGITLANKEGKTVSLLTSPLNVEFMHLNGGVEPLTTVSVPQDVYTSATISIIDGVPLCTADSTSGSNPGLYTASVDSAQPAGVTVNLPQPITVTGTGMGLELNLQVSQSTNYVDCRGIVYGALPFSLTPTFNVAPVAFAAQPTNNTNGKATGLRGLIETVATGGTSFSVTGDFGTSVSGPTWQVTSNSNTVFQGVTGASQLVAGIPVDMDVAIQADGTLAATRVAVYDTTPSTLSFTRGPPNLVSAMISPPVSEPIVDALNVEEQGPAFLGLESAAVAYDFANATFQISGQMTNVSTLPFTASFDAANMVSGQNLFITTHSTEKSGYLSAATLSLIPQTLNGTVSAISSSGNFTTYTVGLAAYDLFPNLAVQPGQATLLTNPSNVIAYADSNTQMLNTNPPAVGSVVRINGLVFNDNGTLRMDCAQISDGVKE
jgi:hypothetical protein